MAHEIERASDFAYNAAGGKPWHVGETGCQPFPGGGPATPNEAQRLVLPWTVEETPLVTAGGIVVPDAKGLVRADTRKYLGTVGTERKTLQNADVADIITSIFGDVPIIETVGALRGGEKTFFLVRLANAVEVTPGDAIQRYFLVFNPHDGTSSVRLRIVNIRVVCANTLRIAFREDTKEFTVRHSEGVKRGVETAARLLLGEEADRATTATFLQATRERVLSKAEFSALLDTVAPLPPPAAPKRLELPAGVHGPVQEVVRDNQGRARNRRAFLSALFYDGVAERTVTNAEGEKVTETHNLDGRELDGGHTAYRALQVVSQDADRSRTVQKGTDRKIQNLFGEGAGADNVEATVQYLAGLVGVSAG